MSTRARIVLICLAAIIFGIAVQVWEHLRNKIKHQSSRQGGNPSLADDLPVFPENGDEQDTKLSEPFPGFKAKLDLVPQVPLPPVSGPKLPLDSPHGLPSLSESIDNLGPAPGMPQLGPGGVDELKLPTDLPAGGGLPSDRASGGSR